MANSNHEILLIVFVALTGLALAVQAIVLLAVLFAGKKAYASLRVEFDELRESALPMLKASRALYDRIGPNIEPVAADIVKVAANMKTVTTDLAALTTSLRTQADGVQASAAELMARTRQQAARVDAMLTNLLDAADSLVDSLQKAVGVPARQLAGVLAAFKAVVESLRHSQPAARRTQSSNDHESFI
jgi:hypothetical protein